jgi:N-methylhydantoinase B/oxoprolinase/acetone carboxylase alpha subunit
VSEEALLVDTESGGVTALRNGTGVGDGHAEGSNRVLNDIEVLESGGDTVLGGE